MSPSMKAANPRNLLSDANAKVSRVVQTIRDARISDAVKNAAANVRPSFNHLLGVVK
jgi:hypothetical protein